MLWLRQICGLFIVFMLTVFAPTAGMSAGKEGPDPEFCILQKVSGRGRPNRIRAMASMNAVIQWLILTKKKHGEEYAHWHTAFGKKIACEQVRDSDLHICYAAGKPCKIKPKTTDKSKGELPRPEKKTSDK